MITLLAGLALAQTPDQSVIVVQNHAAVAEPPMDDRSHVAVGFAFGASSGFGPSLGIPIGRRHRLNLTAAPIVLPDTAVWSAGVRMQHYLGSNPRTRVYLTESVGHHGSSEASGVLAIGAGAGVETRKAFGTGRIGWFEVDLTVLATEGTAVLLPLPQLGMAWEF